MPTSAPDASTRPGAEPSVDVAELQRAVLRGLRRGARFSTSHKEGGTTIHFDGHRFVRADHGEWTGLEHFDSDAALLAFLRRYFDWEITRQAGAAGVDEAAAWRLILARLERPSAGGAASNLLGRWSPAARAAGVLAVVVTVFAVIGTAAWWHEGRSRAEFKPPAAMPAVPKVPALGSAPGRTERP